MEELLSILEDLKPGVDFRKETSLIDDHILTSLDIMTLAMEIDENFDVTMTPLDLVPENFQSAEAMLALITRLQEES